MRNPAIIAAVSAFALVVLLVPIVMRICARWRLYDRPGPLKIHRKPTPRLGGIAVALAVLGGSLLSTRSATGDLPVFAAIILICAVGAIDDIRGLSVIVRLAAQISAGALLWLSCGQPAVLHSSTIGLLAASLFTVAIVNSLNFLDGADGIASGVAGIIAVAYGVLARSTADHLMAAIAWALAGSCAGFLLFNFPAPAARLFLGDCGSTSLGLCVAYFGLRFYHSPVAAGPRLFFPLMAAALPLLDMALATMRRIQRGASPLSGDRMHLSDLLLTRRMPAPAVALVCYGVTALFVLTGFAAWRVKPVAFFLLATSGVGAALAAAIRLGALQRDTTGEAQEGRVLPGLDRSREAS